MMKGSGEVASREGVGKLKGNRGSCGSGLPAAPPPLHALYGLPGRRQLCAPDSQP